MRRRFVLGALSAALAVPLAGSEPAAARIRIEPESFDFGRVLPQRTLRKEFRLLNLGDQPLEISGISKSCGCTRAVVAQTTLEPGEATTLSVEIETRRSSGRIEQQVLVRSNDPQTPVFEVKLRATVVAAEPR